MAGRKRDERQHQPRDEARRLTVRDLAGGAEMDPRTGTIGGPDGPTGVVTTDGGAAGEPYASRGSEHEAETGGGAPGAPGEVPERGTARAARREAGDAAGCGGRDGRDGQGAHSRGAQSITEQNRDSSEE